MPHLCLSSCWLFVRRDPSLVSAPPKLRSPSPSEALSLDPSPSFDSPQRARAVRRGAMRCTTVLRIWNGADVRLDVYTPYRAAGLCRIMQDYAGLCRLFSFYMLCNSESPTSSHRRTMPHFLLRSVMMSPSDLEPCQSQFCDVVHRYYPSRKDSASLIRWARWP